MKHCMMIPSILGKLLLEEEDGKIVCLLFERDIPANVEQSDTPTLRKAAQELSEYFAGNRKEFDIPLNPKGTDFQKSVWNALCTIPYGKTMSYGQVAAQIGNPKASRAVGMANNKNPIPILIPCHRVIGANGKLVGYGGGIWIKQKLLELEQK